MYLNSELKFKLLQLIRFIFVGFSNTLISLIVYYVLVYIGVNYLISNVVGYIISSIWGYFLSKIWVFSAKKVSVKESLIKFYITYGSSFLLNVCLMFIWVNIFEISKLVAPILTLFFTIPYNFILSKFWVFKLKD